MKPQVIAGIVLILLGVIGLAMGGVGFTQREKVLDIGPIEATKETRKEFPIPPVISWVFLGTGIVLVALGAKKS